MSVTVFLFLLYNLPPTATIAIHEKNAKFEISLFYFQAFRGWKNWGYL